MSTISEETILRIKSKMQIAEVVEEFIVLKPKGKDLTACCPFHNEKTPSFYVSPSRNIYTCFGCSKSGDAISFLMEQKMSFPEALRHLAFKYNIPIEEESKTFVKPEWKNKTNLSPVIVKWFEDRHIRQATLTKMKISQGLEYMPQVEKEVGTMQFNYFMDGELVNTKYRTANKEFKLYKHAKLIFYNIDSLIGKKEVIITEGEIDALSLIEAGLDEVYGIVSVPNGASVNNNNLAYVDNCISRFDHIEKIHIGTDNDTAGRKLREELSERFGRDRCDYIEWKDKKDANDVLSTYGIEGVHDCVNKRINFRLEGTFTLSDFSYEIDDMYKNGLERGVSIKLDDFSLRFVPGYVTTVTGIPGMGKSTFVDEITMRLFAFRQWGGAYYSPENRPTQLHISKIIRKLTGKNWDGENRVTPEDIKQAKDFLDKKVFFIKPEKDFTIQSICKAALDLKHRYGIKWFVIDAWNKLAHKGGKNLSYIAETLDYLVTFCENNGIHCFLVVHPRKMDRDKKTGKREVPTAYDIADSSDFANKSDNVISVYVNWETGDVDIHIQKVKFDHWGWISKATYKFDKASMRYYPELKPENKNWITGEPIWKEEPKPEPKSEAVQQKLYDEGVVIVQNNNQVPEEEPF